jgi:hypothetical protein
MQHTKSSIILRSAFAAAVVALYAIPTAGGAYVAGCLPDLPSTLVRPSAPLWDQPSVRRLLPGFMTSLRAFFDDTA